MEVGRGDIWWVALPDPVASAPAGSRPVLVVQANAFNRSRISTVIAAVITTNLRLGDAPGNIVLATKESGLDRPSVVNLSQLITVDREFLRGYVSRLRSAVMSRVDEGLMLGVGLV